MLFHSRDHGLCENKERQKIAYDLEYHTELKTSLPSIKELY